MKSFIFYLGVFCFFSQIVFPQDSAWTNITPQNFQSVYELKSDNVSNLFAVTNSGLFVTQDNCKSWKQLLAKDNLEYLSINHGNHILCGSYDTLMYFSSDMGKNWEKNPAPGGLYGLVMDSSGNCWALTAYVLYKSSDNGRSWTQTNIPTPYLFFHRMKISKQNDIFIQAVKQLYRSTDGGQTWIILPVVLRDISDNIAFNNDGEVFLSVENKGILASKDKGDTWEIKNDQIDFNVQAMEFDSSGNIFCGDKYKGTYKSSDQGANWKYIGCKDLIYDFNFYKGVLYSGGGWGLFKYNPNYIEPVRPKNIFPLHIGDKWQYLVMEGSYNMDPGPVTYYLNNVYVVKDTLINGLTYYELSNSMGYWFRYSETDNKVYMFGNNKEKTCMDFSLPDGSPFSQYIIEQHFSLSSIVSSGQENLLNQNVYFTKFVSGCEHCAGEYIVTKYNSGFGLSYMDQSSYYMGIGTFFTDYFLIQAQINDGTSPKNYSEVHIPQITIIPPKTVPDSAFKFTLAVDHYYSSFSSSGKSLNYIDTVYLSGYYQKGDSVVSPTWINTKNIAGTNGYSVDTTVAIDLLKRGFTFYYKVYAKDKGIIPGISVSPDTGYYKLDYSPNISGVKDVKNNLITTFQLEQSYPNPANPTTIIRYAVPYESRVKLTLYNMLGQIVKVLADDIKPTGIYEVRVDGGKLSSGIYFYSMQAEKFSQTKKLILLK
jgi:photosystem II stability/assembly factor-like uncharacterized protein